MIELRKILIFLVVISLFMYMIWMNFKVLNKYGNKKFLTALMISGFGLISAGAFFDVISEFINRNITEVITTCFIAGAIVFGTYIVLWSKYVVNVISSLHKKAHNDTMTGVYNRSGFEKMFQERVARKKMFYIMVFDLDKTKSINDTFGHLKGDQYIIKAAKIIQEEVGKLGFVGRTGGDEFVACVEKVSEDEIIRIKTLIKKRVTNIFNIHDTQISIGHSTYGKDALNLESLLRIADKRMYEDKANRRKYLMNQR